MTPLKNRNPNFFVYRLEGVQDSHFMTKSQVHSRPKFCQLSQSTTTVVPGAQRWKYIPFSVSYSLVVQISQWLRERQFRIFTPGRNVVSGSGSYRTPGPDCTPVLRLLCYISKDRRQNTFQSNITGRLDFIFQSLFTRCRFTHTSSVIMVKAMTSFEIFLTLPT